MFATPSKLIKVLPEQLQLYRCYDYMQELRNAYKQQVNDLVENRLEWLHTGPKRISVDNSVFSRPGLDLVVWMG